MAFRCAEEIDFWVDIFPYPALRYINGRDTIIHDNKAHSWEAMQTMLIITLLVVFVGAATVVVHDADLEEMSSYGHLSRNITYYKFNRKNLQRNGYCFDAFVENNGGKRNIHHVVWKCPESEMCSVNFNCVAKPVIPRTMKCIDECKNTI